MLLSCSYFLRCLCAIRMAACELSVFTFYIRRFTFITTHSTLPVLISQSSLHSYHPTFKSSDTMLNSLTIVSDCTLLVLENVFLRQVQSVFSTSRHGIAISCNVWRTMWFAGDQSARRELWARYAHDLERYAAACPGHHEPVTCVEENGTLDFLVRWRKGTRPLRTAPLTS